MSDFPQSTGTVVDYAGHNDEQPKASWFRSSVVGRLSRGSRNRLGQDVRSLNAISDEPEDQDPEMKLPDFKSLLTVLVGAALFQCSFFIIVSSASLYAAHLGGSPTFAGLTIGIPTVFSGIALLFIARYDGGQYRGPLTMAYAAMILGNVLHALAYKANWLYLILIGRMVTGIGFTSFMYNRKYCSDPRIVGVRQRTTLASWLVVGQCFGFSAGPFLGGILYKVGFSNSVFNGYTSPGWVMAGVWVCFWIASTFLFQDVPKRHRSENHALSFLSQEDGATVADPERFVHRPTPRQWGVIVCMCYYSMTCFFILGSWEANIPVFTAAALGYTPFDAGNFIALGGITSFPFLLFNVWYSRRIQDRITLAIGCTAGFSGLLLTLILLLTDSVSFGSFYTSWFLVALGFNLASTCTLSLLSKQLPDTWNSNVSLAIQYSNYAGRVSGAILGGAGVKIGMVNYVGVQVAVVGIGAVMHTLLWREMKAKMG